MDLLIQRCANVVAASPHLSLDGDAAERTARECLAEQLRLPRWSGPAMLAGVSDDAVVTWLLVYNAINYSYYPDQGQARWWAEIEGIPFGQDDEALGIMAVVAEAIRQGLPLHDGVWLQKLDLDGLGQLLGRAPLAGELPLLDSRLSSLHELGRAFDKWGAPSAMVQAAQGSAIGLVDLLVRECPTWDDQRQRSGVVLPFRKRAQLCVAMIYGRLGGLGLGAFDDVDRLTAFADYRLPQILRWMGILVLEPALARHIDGGRDLLLGSDQETDLRAATVMGAELLRLALIKRFPKVNALIVDHFLWRSAVENQDDLPPFHRTRTTDY
ncbi:MAG: hypothetical protein HN348_28900 [Proteobacteria bacterium]|jgi:hypothetical protein|nr:hypothetical protein [Pseudomonadota bacterium]